MIKKNDLIEITIDSCSVNGSGVGRYEGMAVFIPFVCAGEKVLARVLKVKSTYAYAKIERIIEPSPHRTEPVCPVYSKCGGCVFAHMDYEDELKIKENHVRQCLKRIGGCEPVFEPILSTGSFSRYRNKAQYPLSLTGDELKIGFFSPRSHRVVHCPECKLQPSEFEQILKIFEEYICKYGVTVYDEEKHRGLLRHVYVRKGGATDEIMVCAVINGDSLPYAEKLVGDLTDSNKNIKSVVLNINKEKTNVILGGECLTLFGEDYIEDILCSLRFRISPLSFYQVNRDAAQLLYGKAKEYAALNGNEVLLDLYCGTGTIGLTMADRVSKLIGVEIVPQAVENAKTNAVINGIDNAEFICGDAAAAAQRLKQRGLRPDVVILDPPRKGCDKKLIETVNDMNPDRIVYISCDAATLARDCAVFREFGYEAAKCTPCDMFPRAGHVETVVLLVKLPPDDVINIKLDISELPVSIHDGNATYPEIRNYVIKKHGLKVSSLNISQIKRKYGLPVNDSYNKPKSENSRQPQCTPEKEQAIVDALKYFKMI
ncbi:MAG: 23S rRNA (uracil(1939)-C(5))-methyltransferase RlmD [Clostridiales bacterium]|nr:23S rRNA (uracil(1939)-C(5))-methyltransferase RlmD [Clostridiales bacterium]